PAEASSPSMRTKLAVFGSSMRTSVCSTCCPEVRFSKFPGLRLDIGTTSARLSLIHSRQVYGLDSIWAGSPILLTDKSGPHTRLPMDWHRDASMNCDLIKAVCFGPPRKADL